MIPTIYIPICDETLWLLQPYTYLFNRYWGYTYSVVVLGYKEPDHELPPNFKFVSMGESQEGGANGWSSYLYNYFNSIEDDHVILTLEDFLPAAPPNLKVLESIVAHMKNNDSVGRFDLTWDLFTNCTHTPYPSLNEDISLCEIPKKVEYRVSCQPAIWKRSFLLNILKGTNNPWNFEMHGSKLSDKYSESILSIDDPNFKNFPTKWVAKGAVSRHHPEMVNVLGLTPKCIRELVDLNLLDESKLQWGQWAGPVPRFHELGGYNFDITKMPPHPASPSNWKEWYSTYQS
tara:strand:- start:567 stop:1433 length:867 start_codon:yes stop_codon:yes gene_type:complete